MSCSAAGDGLENGGTSIADVPDSATYEFADIVKDRLQSMFGPADEDFWMQQFYSDEVWHPELSIEGHSGAPAAIQGVMELAMQNTCVAALKMLMRFSACQACRCRLCLLNDATFAPTFSISSLHTFFLTSWNCFAESGQVRRSSRQFEWNSELSKDSLCPERLGHPHRLKHAGDSILPN